MDKARIEVERLSVSTNHGLAIQFNRMGQRTREMFPTILIVNRSRAAALQICSPHKL